MSANQFSDFNAVVSQAFAEAFAYDEATAARVLAWMDSELGKLPPVRGDGFQTEVLRDLRVPQDHREAARSQALQRLRGLIRPQG